MNLEFIENQHQIFVDTHVHIHDCFSMSDFFDAAVENFQQASMRSGSAKAKQSFLLLLTESAGKKYYQKLYELAAREQTLSGRNGMTWFFKGTSEQVALQACRSDGQNVFLLAGKQLITAENLEVLALMTLALIEEKQPLSITVQSVYRAGGIPVIPWGFGKWLGKRRQVLKKFLMENSEPTFLGDNSGRPALFPRPRFFKFVETRGNRVLPGSDPLPFVWENSRAGSFGFTASIAFSPESPAAALKDFLRNPKASFQNYGRLEKPMGFFRNQIMMQLRNRTKKGQ